MTNDADSQPETPGHSRRQVFRFTGLAALALGGPELLAACGSDSSSSGGGGGQQQSGGILVHGATGGSSKDTLDAHRPVTDPDIARVSNLYEPLLFWDNDYQIARPWPSRWSPRPTPRPGRSSCARASTFHNGKDVTPEDVLFTLKRVADPKAPTSAGRHARADHRLRRHQEGRREHGRDQAQDAVRAARLPPRGVHPRHRPGRLRPQEPGRHRRLQVQVVHAGQEQRLHEVRRLLGRQGVRRRAADPGLRRPQRPGQRAAGRPDPDDRQPALQPDRLGEEAGRPDPRGRVRRLGAVHHARRRQAVLRRPGAPGDAPDLRPPADDRPGAERLRPARQRPLRPLRRGLRQGPAPARQDIEQAKSLLKAAGQEGLQVQLFTGDDIGSVAPATAALFVEQAKKAGVDVKVVKKNPFYGDDYLSYPFAQDFWNTRNYIPQAAVCALKGGTYNETHFDNAKFAGLIDAAQRRPTRPSATRCSRTPRRSSTTRAATSSGASATRSTASAPKVQGSSRATTCRWAPTSSRRVSVSA